MVKSRGFGLEACTDAEMPGKRSRIFERSNAHFSQKSLENILGLISEDEHESSSMLQASIKPNLLNKTINNDLKAELTKLATTLTVSIDSAGKSLNEKKGNDKSSGTNNLSKFGKAKVSYGERFNSASQSNNKENASGRSKAERDRSRFARATESCLRKKTVKRV